MRNFQGLYDCCPFLVSGYHQAAPSPLLIEITAIKTHFEGKTGGEVCGCPCGRLSTGGHGDLWPASSCLLFLRPVGHALHGACQLAWPGSESRLSHKWKHQTGSLKAWPWLLRGTRFFSVYPAGLSSDVFHCAVHRFGTLCPFSCKSTVKGAVDHVLDPLGPFCTAAWSWGAFISHFICTTTDVIIDKKCGGQ